MPILFPVFLGDLRKEVSFQEVVAAHTEHSLLAVEPFSRRILRKSVASLSPHRIRDVLRQPPAFLASQYRQPYSELPGRETSHNSGFLEIAGAWGSWQFRLSRKARKIQRGRLCLGVHTCTFRIGKKHVLTHRCH